jgi:nicotinamidase-related amidase
LTEQEEFKRRMEELGKDFDSDSQDISQRWGEDTQAFYAERGIGGRCGFGKTPALIIIDMSIAFNDPSYKVGDEMPDTLEAIAQLQEAARDKGVLVAFAQVAYEKDMKDGGMFGIKIPALAELQLGTEGVEIHPRIAPIEGEHVIIKKYASSFFETNLASLLVSQGVDTVILTGCSTSGCIRASAIDSISHGFRTIVPLEAVSDRAEGPHWANLFDINAKYADVLPLSEVVDYLNSLP